jgi:hypothetical protein
MIGVAKNQSINRFGTRCCKSRNFTPNEETKKANPQVNIICRKIRSGSAISARLNGIRKKTRNMNRIGKLNRKLKKFERTWMVGKTSEAR